MSSIDEHFDLVSDDDMLNVESKDLKELINNLVNKLPEKNATIINLFYLNEMSCEEISKILNISLSNVKVLLHRSRIVLKDHIIKNDLVEELK